MEPMLEMGLELSAHKLGESWAEKHKHDSRKQKLACAAIFLIVAAAVAALASGAGPPPPTPQVAEDSQQSGAMMASGLAAPAKSAADHR